MPKSLVRLPRGVRESRARRVGIKKTADYSSGLKKKEKEIYLTLVRAGRFWKKQEI